MTTRQVVTAWAAKQVGTVHASGYNGPNPYSTLLGRPTEAWCGDFVTAAFKLAGIPLPPMQPGCKTGFAYVPDAWQYAVQRSMVLASWQAQPADLVIFGGPGWDPSLAPGEPGHVGLSMGWAGGVLSEVGGNQGGAIPGGVNAAEWSAPAGTGNELILGVINTGRLVSFGAPAHFTPPAPTPPAGLLMLKSPPMTGTAVKIVQTALDKRGAHLVVDGVYGPLTAAAVRAFQQGAHIGVDGIVGPQTRAALGI